MATLFEERVQLRPLRVVNSQILFQPNYLDIKDYEEVEGIVYDPEILYPSYVEICCTSQTPEGPKQFTRVNMPSTFALHSFNNGNTLVIGATCWYFDGFFNGARLYSPEKDLLAYCTKFGETWTRNGYPPNLISHMQSAVESIRDNGEVCDFYSLGVITKSCEGIISKHMEGKIKRLDEKPNHIPRKLKVYISSVEDAPPSKLHALP